MSRAGGWLLTLGDHRAAVGVREQVHLMLDPAAAELASTPAHCRHVIFWNDRCVPVMDLGRWLDPGAAASAAGPHRHVGVYAYQGGAGMPVEFGALWLARPPQRIEVDDAAASELPGARWGSIATACFADAAGAVPILDLSRIFSGALAG
ncbi:MAG TPA: chemotaxis protein CheW [Burkholderiaceae bacterium]|nr:chemotaxis protein CheW [Burkholderiaceae bacterium]